MRIMSMRFFGVRTRCAVLTALCCMSPLAFGADEPSATPLSAYDLIAGAIDLNRGRTSYTEMSMLVHRPDWERSSSLVAWTRGREDALIRFTAPAKDAGSATLKQGDNMWTYTPKLNRTIRLPFSLMSQSWAGSDFSYNDLSRTDNYDGDPDGVDSL